MGESGQQGKNLGERVREKRIFGGGAGRMRKIKRDPLRERGGVAGKT